MVKLCDIILVHLAGPYPSSKESRHFNSPVTEKANALGDPSVSLLCKQDDLSQPSDVPGYLGETQCSHRSKIQMIIDKYIRDTSWSSLSSLSRQGNVSRKWRIATFRGIIIKFCV